MVPDGLVGVSPWVSCTRAKIQQVAASGATVLITGPTGTGKELIAQAIHRQSPRRKRAFVVVDCASAGESLFASHLFGHRRGAFTGAAHESVGCFRAAEGGTIFLDEVGELGPELQAKLLRVLQGRVVVPLGSHEGVPVDVRVVAATNRDLQHDVDAGRFRQDLYYRLHVVSLTTLELCQRPEDIEPLARHLLEGLAVREGLPMRRLAPAALRRLATYHWPGNVRQLQNLLERAVLFGHDDPLDEDVILEMLSDQPGFHVDSNGHADGTAAPSASPALSKPVGQAASWPTMAAVEREHLLKTVQHAGYNLSAVARLLGWDRKHLHRKLEKYGIQLPAAKPQSGAPRREDSPQSPENGHPS
jgi:DNA-binding NtrC family response regulator